MGALAHAPKVAVDAGRIPDPLSCTAAVTMDPLGAKSYILERLRNELPKERTYHCLEHTLDVYASAIDIAEKEGVVDEEDLTLLKTAALYHDCGFIAHDMDHEQQGCVLVREHLPRFGYSSAQVQRVCDMIMATRIPQSPRNKLSRILCDADLDYLGREDFKRIGDSLFSEMRTFGVLSTELEWNQLQLRFLERHSYFTVTNKKLREPVKQQYLAELRQWLSDTLK
jgi:HD superfamily phosphodiesterase